jgi:hypothetical protein
LGAILARAVCDTTPEIKSVTRTDARAGSENVSQLATQFFGNSADLPVDRVSESWHDEEGIDPPVL